MIQRLLTCLLLPFLAGAVPAQGAWSSVAQSAPPAARQSPRMMAYDSALDRIVLFGGSNAGGTALNNTHVFACSTGTWTQVAAVPAPAPRYAHSVTYDALRNEVVLFGGRLGGAGAPMSNETWVFRGTTWQQLAPTNAPPARYLHAAVYDSTRGVTVLFGGTDATQVRSDTWEWNGVNWTQRATTLPSPNPLRSNSSIAYDPIRQRVVLFGGRTASSFFGGTLEWDGAVWTNVTPAGASPPNRAAGMMAYDATLDRVVLFGGNVSNGNLNDTWYWDGVAWTPVFPGTPPLPRGNAGFVHDPVRERLVLFGGSSSAAHYDQLWAFASATPARFHAFGPGCTGLPLVPTLGPADHRRPWLGDTYALVVQGLPSPGIVVLFTGTSNQSWLGVPLPLPLAAIGMPGCTALVSPELGKVDATGVPIEFDVPYLPALAGLSLHHQAIVLHPQAGTPLGAVASNSIEAVLGLR